MNAIAIPKAARRPFNLSAANFVGESEQILGRESEIARYTVPKNVIFELDQYAPFRLQLKGAVPIVAEGNAVLEVTSEEAGFLFVRTPRPAPSAPTARHPDVRAVVGDQVLEVLEYDADGGVLRLNTDGIEGDGTAYITHGAGTLRFVAEVPQGVDRSQIELYSDSFLALHETSQAEGETAPRMNQSALLRPLGPQYQLKLLAATDAPIPWTTEAKHLLTLKGFTAPMNVLSRQALQAVIAGRLA